MDNNDGLQLASIKSRILAFIIDDAIVSIIVIIAFWDKIVSLSSVMDENQIQMITSALFMPLLFLKLIYQTIFVWYYGATIGKLILKIRVIDDISLQRVSFFQALLRSLGRIVSQSFLYLGFILGFFTEGRKTLHDYVGRTLVVNA